MGVRTCECQVYTFARHVAWEKGLPLHKSCEYDGAITGKKDAWNLMKKSLGSLQNRVQFLSE